MTSPPLPLEDFALPWRLDERTREVGRRGLESARAALEDALRRAAA